MLIGTSLNSLTFLLFYLLIFSTVVVLVARSLPFYWDIITCVWASLSPLLSLISLYNCYLWSCRHLSKKIRPFRLCNAPATHRRLMDLVLSGLQWSGLHVWFIVYGSTFRVHLNKLASIFVRLRKAGLKLHFRIEVLPITKKCQLLWPSCVGAWSGQVVSEHGASPDPTKTEKVANWATPKSVQKVQQFLGLAGYYRRSIETLTELRDQLLMQAGLYQSLSTAVVPFA